MLAFRFWFISYHEALAAVFLEGWKSISQSNRTPGQSAYPSFLFFILASRWIFFILSLLGLRHGSENNATVTRSRSRCRYWLIHCVRAIHQPLAHHGLYSMSVASLAWDLAV